MTLMVLLLVVVATFVCEDNRFTSIRVLVQLLLLHSKPIFLYSTFSCWLSLLPAGYMLSPCGGVIQKTEKQGEGSDIDLSFFCLTFCYCQQHPSTFFFPIWQYLFVPLAPASSSMQFPTIATKFTTPQSESWYPLFRGQVPTPWYPSSNLRDTTTS